MGVLFSKTIQFDGPISLAIEDQLTVDSSELYKLTPLAIQDSLFTTYVGPVIFERRITNFACVPILNSNGRAALVRNDTAGTESYCEFVDGTGYFNYDLVYSENPEYPTEYRNVNYVIGCPRISSNGIGASIFSTNIPIFADITTARLYLEAASDEQALLVLPQAINYKDDAITINTNEYYYIAKHANVDITLGTATPEDEGEYCVLKFLANTEPKFYLTGEGSFEMGLLAPDCVASIYRAASYTEVNDIPITEWTTGSLEYNGPFYCPMNTYTWAFEEYPEDGSYIYPIEFSTNIHIFANREDAEEALITGDNSKSVNPQGQDYSFDLEEETETTFGGGGFMSPFMTILSGSKSDLHRLADVLFTDDGNLWDDIKKGLEMYGSNPIDYIIGCRAFPFDVSRVVTESTRYDVWFGSYKHHFDTAFNEVINMSHKYIDAGSFYFAPIQYSYLDMEPYTQLSVYFPYHGWEILDIKKYYKRRVNFRYYVDILSGQAIIVTTCDGVLTDQFGPFEIGTELPLTGANYAQWAQGQVRLLAQGAQSITSGITSGISSGNIAGFAANTLGSALPASMALLEARQQGGPKNTMVTRGNFGSNLGNYLPGNIIIRFDIHEMLIPSMLQTMVGKPSYSSGSVRNFSGFLSGKVVKLDTSGMTDMEANAIRGLLQSGIYV